MRTNDDSIRVKQFFEKKAKARVRETGSYACEHATDLRNAECQLCLDEIEKPRKRKRA